MFQIDTLLDHMRFHPQFLDWLLGYRCWTAEVSGQPADLTRLKDQLAAAGWHEVAGCPATLLQLTHGGTGLSDPEAGRRLGTWLELEARRLGVDVRVECVQPQPHPSRTTSYSVAGTDTRGRQWTRANRNLSIFATDKIGAEAILRRLSTDHPHLQVRSQWGSVKSAPFITSIVTLVIAIGIQIAVGIENSLFGQHRWANWVWMAIGVSCLIVAVVLDRWQKTVRHEQLIANVALTGAWCIAFGVILVASQQLTQNRINRSDIPFTLMLAGILFGIPYAATMILSRIGKAQRAELKVRLPAQVAVGTVTFVGIFCESQRFALAEGLGITASELDLHWVQQAALAARPLAAALAFVAVTITLCFIVWRLGGRLFASAIAFALLFSGTTVLLDGILDPLNSGVALSHGGYPGNARHLIRRACLAIDQPAPEQQASGSAIDTSQPQLILGEAGTMITIIPDSIPLNGAAPSNGTKQVRTIPRGDIVVTPVKVDKSSPNATPSC